MKSNKKPKFFQMKSVAFLILLVLINEALSGVPVQCLESVAALSVEIEALQPCNRRTTCQFSCQDGTKFYFDINNFPSQYKQQYTTFCNSENPTEWKDSTVHSIIEKQSFGRYKSAVSQRLTSTLSEVFVKFANICHGGGKVSNSDVDAAIKKSSEDAYAAFQASQTVDSRGYSGEKQKSYADDKSKAYSAVSSAVRAFQQKFNSGNFNYCDCGAFAASIGQTNWFNSNVIVPFCPGQYVKPVAAPTPAPTAVSPPKRTINRPNRRRAVIALSYEIEEQTRALEREIDELE
jgi:hypothetical protein